MTETFVHKRFWSTDSSPRGLSLPVSLWRAPAVIISFCVLAYGMLLAINEVPLLNALFPNDDIVFSVYDGGNAIPVRIFIICFAMAFAMFASGPGYQRAYFAVNLITTFIGYCAACDVFNILNFLLFNIVYPLGLVQVVSGVIGFYLFADRIMQIGRMPERTAVKRGNQNTIFPVALLITILTISTVLVTLLMFYSPVQLQWLRDAAVLGGIGPGVLLFFPIIFILLYGFQLLGNLLKSRGPFLQDLTILIPAHNEAHNIAETIWNIDRAAKNYAARVHILIVDNNSTDRTVDQVHMALDGCDFATGSVEHAYYPGKANALNRGLELIKTPYFIRIDADTRVSPDAFTKTMKHFADPHMGVVGGLPMVPGTGQFDRARQIETVLKQGFYQVALYPLDGNVGVAGMFAAYRTDLPRQLGGFATGMNGEDTDISLKIGELGYKVRIDPSIRFVSEVPVSYTHMREQRIRWFRSIYHVTARNVDVMEDWRSSIRGKIILPFMLINSSRRAMMIPLLSIGLIEYFTQFDSSSTLAWQAILAVVFGIPAGMAVLACLLNGMPRALLGLPEFVLFRLFRAYFTLEALLSISMHPDYSDFPELNDQRP